MRASQYYAPTLRQAPAEAEIPSHKLLVRASAASEPVGRPAKGFYGVWSFLGRGWK